MAMNPRYWSDGCVEHFGKMERLINCIQSCFLAVTSQGRSSGYRESTYQISGSIFINFLGQKVTIYPICICSLKNADSVMNMGSKKRGDKTKPSSPEATISKASGEARQSWFVSACAA